MGFLPYVVAPHPHEWEVLVYEVMWDYCTPVAAVTGLVVGLVIGAIIDRQRTAKGTSKEQRPGKQQGTE